MTNKAVFLDRDGTISVDCTDESRIDQSTLQLFSIAPLAIKVLNDMNYKVVLVTNQPGIGKGLFTKDKVFREHRFLLNELLSQGAKIDAIFCCPHTDNDNCECRKPKSGLLLAAQKEFDIDMTQSFIIGDSWRDVEAGKNAGCRGIYVKGKHNKPNIGELFVAEDLLEAVVRLGEIIDGKNI